VSTCQVFNFAKLEKLMNHEKVQVFNYPDSNMKQEFGGFYREVRAEFFGFWTIIVFAA
jgi:hypothetical protein